MANKAGSGKTTGGKAQELPPAIEGAPVTSAAALATAAPAALTEEEFREALYRRLMANHRAVDAKLAEIDSGRKVISKGRTQIRAQLTQAGYSLENVDNILKDTNKTRDDRSKQQGRVDQLKWMREMEGLPVAKTGEQLALELRLPETEKEGIAWEQAGYNSGIIDEPCEIPAGCPPIFHQRWTQYWHQGQERRKWAEAQDVNTERTITDTPVRKVELSPEPADDECETCGGDGSKLDDLIEMCPTCEAEYEPRQPPAGDDGDDLHGGDDDDDEGGPGILAGAPTDDEVDSALDAEGAFDPEGGEAAPGELVH